MSDQFKMFVGIAGAEAERYAREILWERFDFIALDLDGDRASKWDAARAMLKETDHVVSVIHNETQAGYVRACGGTVIHIGKGAALAARDGDLLTLADPTADIIGFLNTHGLKPREFEIQRDGDELTWIERFNEIEAHIDIISSELFSRTTRASIDDAVGALVRSLAAVKGVALALDPPR